ncbi:IS481 family transposase [Haloactinomyces albus]|uniref:IS481 family transposase n=1 Tax=Haloactinomyces albus TaxID=1352928 RepID=UPI00286CF625|nr:IS481 family transposase [Haloactinomyces albus]
MHRTLWRSSCVTAGAPLTETGRLRLARCVVDDGWPLARAAERFQVAVGTAKRWADRYRAHGEAGMVDRSSRPRTSPRRTPTRTERRIIKVRVLRRWGPARIAGFLGLVVSTVHRVLTRYGVARLRALDRATGRVIRRYERAAPGELVHVDVKKLGNIPDGGGHKIHGRAVGTRYSQRTSSTQRRDGKPVLGYGYLHNAVDDHSRLAYSEILADETKDTAAAFWGRAAAWFRAQGITDIQRVLTDNGPCYRSHAWRAAVAATASRHLRTRAYRPQTNGKVERFNRILLDEWAYAEAYTSETARRAALPGFLHWYNHHRHHTSISGPPTHRIPNLSGQNN